MQSVSPAQRANLTPSQSLPINKLTVPHELDARQVLQLKRLGGRPADTRKLSSRALDIEPIGQVTDDLLDHPPVRTSKSLWGRSDTQDHEPKIPLSTLRKLATEHETEELNKFLTKYTRTSSASLKLPTSSEKLCHC
jgi:hypothetical protein